MAGTGGPDWLGLLKWSLQYSDGTKPSEVKPMSEEDKAFLTKVMTEGVYNEPKRMQEIMMNVAIYLEESVEETKSGGSEGATSMGGGGAAASEGAELTKAEKFRLLGREAQAEQALAELGELSDIVEQIDMAQVFVVNLKGAGCILDIVEDKKRVVDNKDVRIRACGVLGTVCQNNTKVQDYIFRTGIVERLVSMALGLLTLPPPPPTPTTLASTGSSLADGARLGFTLDLSRDNADRLAMLAKVLFAISCAIRAHAAGEEAFVCGGDQRGSLLLSSILQPLVTVTEAAIGGGGSGSGGGVESAEDARLARQALARGIINCRKRAVFLANALLSSDTLRGDAKAVLGGAVVPFCFSALKEPATTSAALSEDQRSAGLGLDDEDLREGAIRCILSTLNLSEGDIGKRIVKGGAGQDSGALTAVEARIRALTVSSVNIRRSLGDASEAERLSAERKEEMQYELEKLDSELSSLKDIRSAIK